MLASSEPCVPRLVRHHHRCILNFSQQQSGTTNRLTSGILWLAATLIHTPNGPVLCGSTSWRNFQGTSPTFCPRTSQIWLPSSVKRITSTPAGHLRPLHITYRPQNLTTSTLSSIIPVAARNRLHGTNGPLLLQLYKTASVAITGNSVTRPGIASLAACVHQKG